jgi:uncharacterized protein (DUF697 family)
VSDSLIPSEKKGLFDRLTGRLRHFFQPGTPTCELSIGDLRARTPSPVFWLFGKTQSGKTSIIHYLTGAEAAEIGSGFRPCTRTSRKFPFPEAEAPVLTFLDTRGLGEPGYDPAEDIAAFDKDAHLMLITVRLRDFATGELREALTAIRKANRARPAILVLTCLHEAYPQEQHPQPYPYDTPNSGPVEILRLVGLQQQDFNGLFDRVVLLDLTKPEEGFTDPEYGGPALRKTLLELLPQAYRETLLRFENANEALKSQHLERAAPIIASYCTLAATAGAIPIPGVDLLVLPGIQTKMVHALANLSGNPERGSRFLEFSATLGIGVIARHAARQLVKFVPYLGSAVGAGLAYASTYALGRAFVEYDQEIHAGHAPDAAAVKRLYDAELKTAEARWGERK